MSLGLGVFLGFSSFRTPVSLDYGISQNTSNSKVFTMPTTVQWNSTVKIAAKPRHLWLKFKTLSLRLTASKTVYQLETAHHRGPVTVLWESLACRWKCMISENVSSQILHAIISLGFTFFRCFLLMCLVTSPWEANFWARFGGSRSGWPTQIKQNKGRWSFIADRRAISRGVSGWQVLSITSLSSWRWSWTSTCFPGSSDLLFRGKRQVSPSWNWQ